MQQKIHKEKNHPENCAGKYRPEEQSKLMPKIGESKRWQKTDILESSVLMRKYKIKAKKPD